KDKAKKSIYTIIFLFIALFLCLPIIAPAEEIPPENTSGVKIKIERIPPENTSGANKEEITPRNTSGVQIKKITPEGTTIQIEKIPPENTSGGQIEKIPQENTSGVQIEKIPPEGTTIQIEKNPPGNAPDVQIAKPAELSDENQTQFQKFKNYFSADLRILTYGVIQEPSKSSQNPNNDFIQIPQYTANAEIRPDFRFDSKFLELAFKPRAKFDFKAWQEGVREDETEWKDDWYINEWLVRLKILDRIFVSYGRENLQWGPSFLFSPSNPFFSDNGRSNPYMEVPGMDFARLVLIPHSLWTMSVIVNTNEGRNPLLGLDPFEITAAAKIDFTGRKYYASLIFSERDSDVTVGFFGGWTVSDAVLLYGEGSLAKGSRALYPQKDASPFGASMQKIHEDDSDIKPVILAGASYTFANSGTFSLEYLYNAPGYSNEEADLYYILRQNAADAFEAGGIMGLLGQGVLSQTANPGLRFLRKNYVLLQYYQGNILSKLDLTFRWTQNLDDVSGQFLGLLSYSLGNHWELFSSGVINAGPRDTEFGSILNYQVMFGLKFTL
ncbi:MAG: hypothetical protein NTW65_05460, partial [Deltaproteobacteria bacterium]|nr:hypothetical protein [Deltaproteobacteria bacterium]